MFKAPCTAGMLYPPPTEAEADTIVVMACMHVWVLFFGLTMRGSSDSDDPQGTPEASLGEHNLGQRG